MLLLELLQASSRCFFGRPTGRLIFKGLFFLRNSITDSEQLTKVISNIKVPYKLDIFVIITAVEIRGEWRNYKKFYHNFTKRIIRINLEMTVHKNYLCSKLEMRIFRKITIHTEFQVVSIPHYKQQSLTK